MPKRAIFTGIDIESKKQRTVRHYRGTVPKSTRNPISREEVKRSLKRLNLNFDAKTGEIHPKVSEEQYQKRVVQAEQYADKNGDLIRRYHDDRLCFGVPHWRAMSLVCEHCGSKEQCDKVVSLRLMFGGVEQFKAALSDIAARKRLYDKKAKGHSQGYELEVSDRDIRDLRVLYHAYWKMSDETFGHRRGWNNRRINENRRRDLAARKQARDRIMIRYEGLPNPEPQDVAEAIKTIDHPVTEKYAASISDGALESSVREYESFKARYSHLHKWRKLTPGRLAIVKVCRDAIVQFRGGSETGLYQPKYKEVHDAAADLRRALNILKPEAGDIYGSPDMNYNEVHRLMKKLSDIEAEVKKTPAK